MKFTKPTEAPPGRTFASNGVRFECDGGNELGSLGKPHLGGIPCCPICHKDLEFEHDDVILEYNTLEVAHCCGKIYKAKFCQVRIEVSDDGEFCKRCQNYLSTCECDDDDDDDDDRGYCWMTDTDKKCDLCGSCGRKPMG